MVDMVDCTGSGDVDTSQVRRANEQHQVEALSGRTLQLSPEWSNPSGEWRVGLKRGYELFPAPLATRVKAERREAHDEAHRRLVERATAELQAWDAAHEGSSASAAQMDERAELRARLDQLQALNKSFDDVVREGTQLGLVCCHHV